jgi:hypothetical protein
MNQYLLIKCGSGPRPSTATAALGKKSHPELQ